jgi:dsDNA-binding SOS-regulon protein
MLKEGLDYKEISSRLGLSQTAFYKNKEAGMLDEIIELTDNIAELLNSWITE